MGTWWTIFAATAGGAAIRAGWFSYREWKAARPSPTINQRSARSLVDRRLKVIEVIFWLAIIGPPIVGFALFVGWFGLNLFGYQIIAPSYPVEAIGAR